MALSRMYCHECKGSSFVIIVLNIVILFLYILRSLSHERVARVSRYPSSIHTAPHPAYNLPSCCRSGVRLAAQRCRRFTYLGNRFRAERRGLVARSLSGICFLSSLYFNLMQSAYRALFRFCLSCVSSCAYCPSIPFLSHRLLSLIP